ncbi:hypothetical protein [Phycicoccus sonneratiae]|uniref:Uncharacterized protein n=1 Tax=Phycicoccus sonneratiae TaxID=2807628 RepID=A0ABS2CHE8_9MICO|nr:hypothetical protein [Phycicoccus sonneraticus]MBM6399304.1 hypothetical protein [Phycicoccus sonneraticus]
MDPHPPGPGVATGPDGPAHPTGRPHLLAGAAAVATLAVLLVPAGLVALRGFRGEAALGAAARSAVVGADPARPVADSAALAELVAAWREFHLVKALLAGLLVLLLVALASTVGRRVAAATGRRRRWTLLSAYGAVLAWLLAALTVLLANLQGAAAPLASVASFLPPGRSTGELGEAQERMTAALGGGPRGTVGGVAGDLLVDFTRYHAVFAVLAAVTGVVLTTLAARAVLRRWRRRGAAPVAEPTWPVRAAAYGAAGGLFLLLAAANVSTWVHPVPALVASLGG